MRHFWIAPVCLLLSVALPAWAADDPWATLTGRLEGCYAAMRAGDVDTALGCYSEGEKARYWGDIGADGESRKQMVEQFQKIAPAKFIVEKFTGFAEKPGLLTLETRRGASGQIVREEVQSDFVRENGLWMISNRGEMMVVDDFRMHPPDDVPEPVSAYHSDVSVIGGSVVRVKYEAAYTLVVIQMLNELHDLFLPPKAQLEAAGIETERLREGAIVSGIGASCYCSAFKHRIDSVTIED